MAIYSKYKLKQNKNFIKIINEIKINDFEILKSCDLEEVDKVKEMILIDEIVTNNSYPLFLNDLASLSNDKLLTYLKNIRPISEI